MGFPILIGGSPLVRQHAGGCRDAILLRKQQHDTICEMLEAVRPSPSQIQKKSMETFGINIPNKTAEAKRPVDNEFPEEEG